MFRPRRGSIACGETDGSRVDDLRSPSLTGWWFQNVSDMFMFNLYMIDPTDYILSILVLLKAVETSNQFSFRS